MFTTLEDGFEAHRAQLQAGLEGVEPEDVLVLETVGGIDNFVRAVKGIPGLEWLGDTDLEDTPPDEEFYIDRDQPQGLPGRLYLVMTNQRGLQELLSLWNRFCLNPEAPRFAKGRTKWRDLFDQLRDVRRWGPEDRLAGTGFENELRDILPGTQEAVSAEIELWYRSDSTLRRTAQTAVSRLVQESKGQVLGAVEIHDIRYHGVLAQLPLPSAANVIEHRSPIVLASHVLDIRPVGQSMARSEDRLSYDMPQLPPGPPPAGSPVIAVLDGLPIQGHSALAGGLVVDDPDGWEATYPVESRQHGTAMASLVLRGDLSQPGSASRPIYVRPILRPDLGRPDLPETLPQEVLPVDLVHRAILRLFEPSATEPAVAPSIRIINHSVADRRREFEWSVGAWARLLDFLSWKFNVLMIVPAGNCPIPLDIPDAPARELVDDHERLSRAALASVIRSPSTRRLLSPAEGINVLTVGAIHADMSAGSDIPGLVDPMLAGLPSPMSRHGPGYRRAVKPEISLPGGRMPFAVDVPDDSCRRLVPRDTSAAPGQLVACPSEIGSLSRVRHSRGTSNAAALASRAAAELYEVLAELAQAQPDRAGLTQRHEAVVLKALLVHGAVPPDLTLLAAASTDGNGRNVGYRLCGYGQFDSARVMASEDSRVTLVGWGTLMDRAAHLFTVPVPLALSGHSGLRRLTATLAWMSPISNLHRAYRRVAMWFEPYGPNRPEDELTSLLRLHRRDGDYLRPRRGTVQHEVFEGTEACIVRPDTFGVFQVNCRAEAGPYEGRVRYGFVVTLETSAPLPLYEEIATRIRPRVEVEVGTA